MKDRVDVKKPPQPKKPLPRRPRTGASRQTRAGGQDERRRERSAAAQPERPAGWSLGGAAPEWGPLDLTGGGGKLPPPGDYDAVIADLDLIDKSDVLWMIVSFKLVGLEASPAPMMGMIASRNGPVDQHRVAEGMRLLNRLATATGTPLDAIKDPFDLPGLFIGKPVKLTVVHKARDGIPELVVRTIRPR